MSAPELPECAWHDVLAILRRAFERAGFGEKRVAGLMGHAAVIGDDLEGWGVLENCAYPMNPAEVARGVVACIVGDIYSMAEDDACAHMRLTLYAAAEAWAARVEEAMDA